jgi:hypothetical protein
VLKSAAVDGCSSVRILPEEPTPLKPLSDLPPPSARMSTVPLLAAAEARLVRTDCGLSWVQVRIE